MSSSKELIILRGLSGSGKSTLASLLAVPGSVICSADEYFMENGVYNFVPSELPRAHMGCQMKAERAMSDGVVRVIIDNLNVEEVHMAPYERLGAKYGYRIHYIVIENRRGAKSAKVPDHAMMRHARLFTLKLI